MINDKFYHQDINVYFKVESTDMIDYNTFDQQFEIPQF